MSNRYIGGFIRPGYDQLKVPNAPTIGAVTAGDAQVSVAFTAPSCVGGGAITSYTAYTSCNRSAASNTTSPVVVTGLTNGTSYTFRVIANNAFGPSSPSGVSASASPIITTGQQAFTTAGSFTWVAPASVTSVSIVAVGAGSTGGGALVYGNNISVTPGTSYAVVVGAGNCSSNRASKFATTVLVANGGGACNTSATSSGSSKSGGGNGGASAGVAGGGGAGGYTGAGGNSVQYGSGNSGSGGGGGAGGGYNGSCYFGGGGGGVGILGLGSSGAGGSFPSNGGSGGSGGANGQLGTCSPGNGGAYGGGAGYNGSYGANGAVRIIWPGTTRSFPSTNTGDL